MRIAIFYANELVSTNKKKHNNIQKSEVNLEE